MTCTLRHRLRLAATVLLLGLAVPVVAQAASQPAGATVTLATTGGVQPSSESQLLSLTNSARASAGLPALVSSSTLVSLARGWSAHMAAAHALSHNPALASSVSGWYSIGENVAEAGSAGQAQALFMGSPEHRSNILDRLYNRVGIGVVQASDGTLWLTVDFEQTAGYLPPAPHQGAPHHPVATRPATHAVTTVSAADRLLAARRAAAARANRSLARATVPGARAAAAARTARPLSQQDTVDALGAPSRTAVGAGLQPTAGSGSVLDLLWVGGFAVAFVMASIAGQLASRRERG